MRKKILITGHTGFIGKHAETYFRSKNDKFFVDVMPSVDITKTKQVKKYLKTLQPDIIVHLAAKAVPGGDLEQHPKMVKTNICGTQNLLTYAPKGCRFIFASSIVAYGTWKYDPFSVDKEGFKETDCLTPTSIYGITKAASEALIYNYMEQGLISGAILRLSAVVGSGLTHGALRDIVKKVVDTTQKTLKLMGTDPGSIKPYISVKAVIEAIELAINSEATGCFNIASRNSISIASLVDIIEDYVNHYYFVPKKVREWSGETFIGDNSKLRVLTSSAETELGWKSETAQKAILWALQQMDIRGEIIKR